MRILLVEDESLARDRIRRILKDHAEYDIIDEADNGQDALQKIYAQTPDVVLLDIRIPGIDGLEVARHLVDLEEPPSIIFITAYDEYALDAFKVNAVDYLLKPVRAEQLLEALKKVKPANKAQWKALNRDQSGAPKARNYISSRSRRGITLIPVKDIFYFRAEHKYVTVRYPEGEALIDDTLKNLEDEFGNNLARIHRNCLIAVKFLSALEKNDQGLPCVRLRGLDETLDVSRRHLPKIRQLMMQ